MDSNLNTLERRIMELQIEHRDLDFLIDRLASDAVHDELQLRRLTVKDAIPRLLLLLEPDVPA